MKKMGREQKILIYVMLITIIVSLVSIIGFVKVYAERESPDDIFGKTFDWVFIAFTILPYSVSLITLLLSGYQYIFLNDDRGSRLSCRNAIMLSLFVVLDYAIMAILTIVFLTSKTQENSFISSVVPLLFALSFFASCTGVLNLIVADDKHNCV